MRVNINGTANAWLEIDDDGDVDIVFGGCYDCSGDLVNLSDVNAALQTLKTGGTEAGQEAERPQQPQPEIAEMNKAVRCLAIQVPSSVYDDVKKKWDAVVAQLSGVR